MMKKHFWKIVLLVVVVLMVGSVVLAKQVAKNANEGIELQEHVKGNETASVSLVEYSDFQCPACGQFHPVVKEIVETYGNNLRFEYKHFPLSTIHPHAISAAIAAEAAGQQGKFFEMHDKLFENQKTWSAAPTPQVFFLQYAQELGLDVDLFKRHMRASILKEKVNTEFNEARDKGLTGTPSFYLNGTKMEFQTFQQFKEQVEAALGILPEGQAETSGTNTNTVEFGLPTS
jgi:protein-disulfide isomerase